MEASAVAAEMTAVVSGSSFSYAVAAETAMEALSAAAVVDVAAAAAVVDVAAAAAVETIAAAASIPSRHANGIRRRTIKWSGIRVRTASRSNSAGIFSV